MIELKDKKFDFKYGLKIVRINLSCHVVAQTL